MKLSTRGRYGLRILMELAAHYGGGPLPVEAIARSQEIPAKYIHTLAVGLKAAGLVRASRGPTGGYELARDPATITALDAVSAVEGRIAPVDCVADASYCPRAARCAAREVWCEMAHALKQALSGFTVKELAAREASALRGAGTYSI